MMVSEWTLMVNMFSLASELCVAGWKCPVRGEGASQSGDADGRRSSHINVIVVIRLETLSVFVTFAPSNNDLDR